LKSVIAKLKGVSAEQIFPGNGSDEAIDLLIRAFCEPAKDKILVFTPTYGMYNTFAAIHDVEVIEIPLIPDTFQLPPVSDFSDRLEEANLLFLCSPNNPTGNLLDKDAIRQLACNFEGLVILDEAYIDFTDDNGMLQELNSIPNLVVLQTFSKAWGMAGIRLGMAFAHPSIIDVLNKIKAPYNVNILTQRAAVSALQDHERFSSNVKALVSERMHLSGLIAEIDNVARVYPSEANFLLVQFVNPKDVYAELVSNGIVVRDRTGAIPGCLRITIGTPEENNILMQTLINIGE
jgi:histidinol-phosphate aminotransferase